MLSERDARIRSRSIVEAGVSSVDWEERQAIGPETRLRMISYVLYASITLYHYSEYPMPFYQAPCCKLLVMLPVHKLRYAETWASAPAALLAHTAHTSWHS